MKKTTKYLEIQVGSGSSSVGGNFEANPEGFKKAVKAIDEVREPKNNEYDEHWATVKLTVVLIKRTESIQYIDNGRNKETHIVIQDDDKDQIAFIGIFSECKDYVKGNHNDYFTILTVEKWQKLS